MGAFLALPASAADYDFDGIFRVTASAGSCTQYDPVGDRLFARLRYRISVDANNWDWILTLYGDGYGRGYAVENGYPSPSYKVVQSIYIGGGGWGPDDSVANVYLRQTAINVVPTGSINANTKFVAIEADFQLRLHAGLLGDVQRVAPEAHLRLTITSSRYLP